MADNNKQENQLNKGTSAIKKAELKGDIKAFGKQRKVQYVGLTIVAALLIIIVLSFGLPTFSLQKISWTKFAILFAICCLGLFAGYVEGQEWALNRKSGLYQYTLSKYDLAYQNMLDLICYFGQYCDELHIKKRKEYVTKILNNWGIEDERVLDLSVDELHELVGKHYRKNWLGDENHAPSKNADKYKEGDIGVNGKKEPYISYFDPYTEEQVKVIEGCITGYFDIEKISKEYFLNPTAKKIVDPYFNANSFQKQKTQLTITKVLARLMMLTATTIIMAGIGFELYGTGEGETGAVILQRIWDTGSRIFMLFSSVIYSFIVGIEIVKIDTYYLEFRRLTLVSFKQEYDKGIFIPKDKQLERAKEFEKEEKAKQEYLKNIITPEVVTDNIKQIENNGSKLDYTKD